MGIDSTQIMFNEVYEILNIIGSKYISKIPRGLYEFIKSERIENYEIKLNLNQNISDQISEEALALIAYLNLMYWSSLEEKEELMEIYFENDKKELSSN